MRKMKNLIIGAASLALAIVTCTGTEVGKIMRKAAFASAGVFDGADKLEETHKPLPDSSSSVSEITAQYSESVLSMIESAQSEIRSETNTKSGEIISLNRADNVDDTDYSQFTERSGAINRYTIGKMPGTDYITLESGAQVWNCTEIENSTLESAAEKTPEFHRNAEKSPRVLIYHTHSNESFLPKADWYDKSYPLRSADCSRNMVAVGDALCEALARNGVSVIHECKTHDYPMFTGAYYRSADSVNSILEKYPDIDIIIDLHRDGIVQSDGSLGAPVCEVNGKTAAQFMIISCCENEDFDMPNYIENFKLACLLQNTAEEMYPGLSRPVLFDYRNYNQDLSSGALLIEVGSHGNSLDEALYTGELLGNVIAKALEKGAIRD